MLYSGLTLSIDMPQYRLDISLLQLVGVVNHEIEDITQRLRHSCEKTATVGDGLMWDRQLNPG